MEAPIPHPHTMTTYRERWIAVRAAKATRHLLGDLFFRAGLLGDLL